jgi:hypothetical protein
MEEAYQALNRGRHGEQQARVVHPLPGSTRGGSGRCPISMAADFSLPQRPLVDHLLHTWWEEVHLHNPILHRPTFMKRYEPQPLPTLPILTLSQIQPTME